MKRTHLLSLIAGVMLITARVGSQPAQAQPGAGIITYTLADGHVYRTTVGEIPLIENISLALDELAPGADEWLNISPDGAWLLLSTERFDPECAGWACLVLLTANLEAVHVLTLPDGSPIHASGFSAVASGGEGVVYTADGGPHALDLWIVHQTARHGAPHSC